MDYLKRAQANLKKLGDQAKAEYGAKLKAVFDDKRDITNMLAPCELTPELLAASELVRKATRAAAAGISDADLAALAAVPAEAPAKDSKKK